MSIYPLNQNIEILDTLRKRQKCSLIQKSKEITLKPINFRYTDIGLPHASIKTIKVKNMKIFIFP